jgi:hypothetical protein
MDTGGAAKYCGPFTNHPMWETGDVMHADFAEK